MTIELKVMEAYTRDVGRGVVRVDYDTMDKLDCNTGDVIEVIGKRKTVAKALPLYPSDEKKGIIRMDGLGRNNSGIAIGDKVTIKNVKAVGAERVVVVPLETIPPIDERYLADALESVPLIKGDNLMVPYFGGRLTFKVLSTTPAQAVIITQKTIFEITDITKQKAKQKEIQVNKLEWIESILGKAVVTNFKSPQGQIDFTLFLEKMWGLRVD